MNGLNDPQENIPDLYGMNDPNPPRVPNAMLQNLSEMLLVEVLEYLTLTDRRRTLASCHGLWKQRQSLENNVKKLQIRSTNELQGALLTRHLLMDRYGPVLSNLTNLIHLDVGSHGTDGLLYLLPTSGCCSTLQSLSMVGSSQVTDVGLMLMTRRRPAVTHIQSLSILNDLSFQASRAAMVERPPHRSSPLSSLAYVDLTFCRRTTYEGTMWLRNGLQNLRCIRRIPSWMEGHFHTPFGPDGGVEIHTYWPDGTFSFTRDRQSNGFVLDLFSCDGTVHVHGTNDQGGGSDDFGAIDFVGDKLQYNDAEFQDGWPEIYQYAYRPGVSLFKLPPEEGKDSTTQCVLVGQYLRGLKPPCTRLWMEHIASENIPVGVSKHYARHCSRGYQRELIETELDDDFHNDPRGPRAEVMVTKMKVEPLHSPEMMLPTAKGGNSNDFQNALPPDSLVENCRSTCRKLHQFDYRRLEEIEEQLDIEMRSL